MVDAAVATGMISRVYAERWPNKVALTDGIRERTFSELHENANRLANALVARGLTAGDAVALVCGNRVEFVETLMACERTGLRLTPVNWHLSEEEANYIIADCEAKAVVAEGRFLGKETQAKFSDLLQIAIGGGDGNALSYSDVLSASSAADPANPVHGTIMLYTSGTTGRPKGVYKAKAEPVEPQLEGSFANYDPENDAQLVCGPAYHAAPLLFDIRWPLASGVPVHLLPKWDSRNVLELIEQKQITHAHMVPIMFQRLLELPEDERRSADLSSLKLIPHGAAPCPPSVKRAMIDWLGPILLEYYAGSEGGAGIHISSSDWLKKPGSVGRVPEDGSLRILDEAGQPVPQGEEGEIFHRGNPDNPFEYFKAPEKTSENLRDGFFSMGDIGRVDEDGFLYLTGRSAECIISGGVNIYPKEIDDAIASHPAVADVCVIGVPSERWGEEVRAVVQLKPGISGDESTSQSIFDQLGRSLSAFKIPKAIDYVDELPRLPSGKVPRARVREPYWRNENRKI